MIVKNNWFQENLGERFNQYMSAGDKLFSEPFKDFDVNFNLYEFQEKTFDEAVDSACKEISQKYKNLFLAFSGGMDSEFVLRAFHRNGIPITPIIVCYGNEYENEYAYETCEELGVNYIKVEVSDEVFFQCYYSCIIKKLSGVGENSTQLIFAAEVAKERKGTLITGEHLLGQGDDIIEEDYFAFCNEWDFYADHIYDGQLDIIPFFLYTPELTYSMFPSIYDLCLWNEHKAKLYKIPLRRKLYPCYSNDIIYKINIVKQFVPQLKRGCFWSRNEILDIFNKFKR